MSTINEENKKNNVREIIEEAIDKAMATPDDDKSKKFYEELLKFIETYPHNPDAKEMAEELDKMTSSSADSETRGGKSK